MQVSSQTCSCSRKKERDGVGVCGISLKPQLCLCRLLLSACTASSDVRRDAELADSRAPLSIPFTHQSPQTTTAGRVPPPASHASSCGGYEQQLIGQLSEWPELLMTSEAPRRQHFLALVFPRDTRFKRRTPWSWCQREVPTLPFTCWSKSAFSHCSFRTPAD